MAFRTSAGMSDPPNMVKVAWALMMGRMPNESYDEVMPFLRMDGWCWKIVFSS
jgi:hypothetical protein